MEEKIKELKELVKEIDYYTERILSTDIIGRYDMKRIEEYEQAKEDATAELIEKIRKM